MAVVGSPAECIAELAKFLHTQPAPGCVGISHTRWATHGPANDKNAHPHMGGDGAVAVVHNGVIENYAALKRQMQGEGVVFYTDTATHTSLGYALSASGTATASSGSSSGSVTLKILRNRSEMLVKISVGKRPKPARRPETE